jgi:hypothetical protein
MKEGYGKLTTIGVGNSVSEPQHESVMFFTVASCYTRRV